MNTVFSPTLPILDKIFNLWNETIPSLHGVANLSYSLVFQRLPTTIPSSDNTLGLDFLAGSLVLCLLSVSWVDDVDDMLVYNTIKALIDQVEQATKASDLYHPFQYLNYAAKFQNPLDSYGSVGKSFLQKVSKKYDPLGIFQTSVSGGFKIFS